MLLSKIWSNNGATSSDKPEVALIENFSPAEHLELILEASQNFSGEDAFDHAKGLVEELDFFLEAQAPKIIDVVQGRRAEVKVIKGVLADSFVGVMRTVFDHNKFNKAQLSDLLKHARGRITSVNLCGEGDGMTLSAAALCNEAIASLPWEVKEKHTETKTADVAVAEQVDGENAPNVVRYPAISVEVR